MRTGSRFFRCSGLILSGPGAVRSLTDETACRIWEGRRGRLLDELEKIRIEKEPNRVYYVEAGSGAQRIVPAPLSNPITEQEMYNPLAQAYIDEARRAAI
ncbi:hypothetical protein DICVIV_05341 [Dictyocaulus viviparus]|uniref:Uncharacterized protein n=1 Tax=Dictyocaulus viviparus TaxID=29172 RepID=A0A0D8XVK9_DICVI|nr:hypothetical protein DICVIV_05341 [Dictyocaulus viviparus]